MKFVKLLFIQLFIFAFLGELILRFLYPLPEEKPKTIHYGTLEESKAMGWYPKSNYSFQDSIYDAVWNLYEVKYQSYENGFKVFGNTQEDSLKKVWFLGDSFTQAAEVSNGETYYEIIGDSLNLELFAFGSSGYGTLQEYLVFEKYIDTIQPDILFWQLCTNDLIDNHYDLEMDCKYKNEARRPYLVNHEIQYKSTERKIHNYLLANSALYFNINVAFNNLLTKWGYKINGEDRIYAEGLEYKAYNEAVENTRAIFKMIKEKISPQTKVIMFCSDTYEPQFSQLVNLAVEQNFIFIHDNIHRVREAITKQKVVHCYDNVHWNEYGHAVVANSLITAINRDQLFEY